MEASTIPHEGVIRAVNGISHGATLRKVGVLLDVRHHRGLRRLDCAGVAAFLLPQYLSGYINVCSVPSGKAAAAAEAEAEPAAEEAPAAEAAAPAAAAAVPAAAPPPPTEAAEEAPTPAPATATAPPPPPPATAAAEAAGSQTTWTDY